jgi:hypothetical protein
VLTPPVNHGLLISPFTSPPTSPRSPSSNYNPYFGSAISERAAASRRFSFGSDAETETCDNCNFGIPKDVSEMLPPGTPGAKEGKGTQASCSPVLRTIQNIVASGSVSSMDDDDDDDEDDLHHSHSHADDGLHHHYHSLNTQSTQLGTSPTPSQDSIDDSNSPHSHHIPLYASSASQTHKHNLTYVTRRNPSAHTLYSRLRHSCIRALSCETLPRGSPSGPLLFGDPIAGYTIAYIFRIPDPRARGSRRTYALQALSPDCWRASAAFAQVTRAFETIANRIVVGADRVLERESSIVSSSRLSEADLLRTAQLSSSMPTSAGAPGEAAASSEGLLLSQRARSSANSPVGSQRNLTDVSSFLSAKTVDPDGYPRVSRDLMRAKGLAEIVGNEKFFVELHAQFCVILYNLAAGLR